ncbi:spermatogenesis-defective protein 39 homolog [Protopterus annectens]|uniref:spermatogenesis-defective protein 39 homolog n=1 Tax=Protopterus annectens TaxID=7888 RepID=UPI001CFA0359|nr:spermatogenesis-defective protein 39 homolog [Protopterus annectens]
MNRTKGDEEEYWHSTKYKGFAFDDDDDDFSRLKESKRAVNSIRGIGEDDDDDDEDYMERVSWSGEPLNSISHTIKESSFRDTHITGTVTEQSQHKPRFESATGSASFPKLSSSYSLSSIFKGKSKADSSLSLSDVLSDTATRIIAPELRKPKSEYQDYVDDWSPEDTVRRMQRNKTYSLERFRSLKQKMELLDEALKLNDGNVITAILIFLKRTLSKEILFQELGSRQVALHHFIRFLKEMKDQKLLLELLKALGRTEDCALIQYKDYLNIQDEMKRKEFLKDCTKLPFSVEDAALVLDHYTLLERQIIIEASDKRSEADGHTEIFKKYPRKATILNMPLITTLYYCCFYHYGEPEGTFSSPANLKKTFKISEKQYLLTATASRAKLKAWFDVDALFTTKNWLGYTKKKAPIGFHRVVDILQKNNAPVEVLHEYIRLVDDVELKLNLAIRNKCHDVVIDTYKDLKDRQQLIAYKSKVEQGTREKRKIEDILNNSQIRWKN